jgi:hypothetical protein
MSDFVITEPLVLDTPIYRFLTFSALMTILEEKRMPLRKIIKWDDPWELPARYLVGIDVFKEKEQEYKVFGNCWTKEPESDALWRIYSQDCKGVCISSTVGMLKKTVIKNHPNISACIAEITYDSVENYLLNDLFGKQYSDKYPQPYLDACIKRQAFTHEQEIRFMVHAKEILAPTPDFFTLEKIDHRFLIKEIIFDPRVDEWYFNTMSKYLSRYKISVRKSPLYTTGKLDVKIKTGMKVMRK